MAGSRKIIEPYGQKCIFCGEDIGYWPRPNHTCGYSNVGYSITKRKSRIWFHISCFKRNAGKRAGEQKNG